MNPSLPRPPSPQKHSPGSENSIFQELQLLITELKERDEELNDMIAVHQRQFLAWEDDRQKILTLGERCNLLNNELNKRNETIKALNKKLQLLESQQHDSERTLENTKQKFKEVSQKATDATLRCQALEEKNRSLHCSVLELSAKAGQLKAREQELLTMLKLKDEVMLETTDHITEFTSKFRKLESTLRASKAEELSLNKEKLDLKLRLRELILETNKLKDDLCEKVKENNKQQEEILHLRQENGCLRNELALTVEKEKRKDQLLQSVKSKQARTDTELSRLRQIYLKQQHDLQFLRVSLESSQEFRQKHERAARERSVGLAFSASESNGKTDAVRTEGTYGICKERGTAEVPKSRVQTTSEMGEVDNRLLLNASDSEEATSAHLHRCEKVVKVLAVPTEEEEKQDVASRSDELGSKVFCEANNTRPLRNREISDNRAESGAQQTFESSSPEYEHWFNISSGVDSQGVFVLIQNTLTSGKTDNEKKAWEERPGILFAQKCKVSPAAVHKSESNSSARSFIIKKGTWWKPVSDLEWLKIFKPIRRDGKDCSCLKTAEEMKCASSKRNHTVAGQECRTRLFCTGCSPHSGQENEMARFKGQQSVRSPDFRSFMEISQPPFRQRSSFSAGSLSSTVNEQLFKLAKDFSQQRADRPQRCEKFSGEDFPLEINNLSVTNPTDRCCSATMDQDTSSPISQLQHTLAESRQMVADLELSAVLPVSPRCSPNSSSINTTAELAEALHRTRLAAGEERDAKLPFFSL